MHFSSFVSAASLGALATLSNAAPLLQTDGTCAPGTGSWQVCSNGFRGCSTQDACASQNGECPAGSFYYVCTNGFRGCSTKNECEAEESVPKDSKTKTPTAPASTPKWYVCASNGFTGSCTVDA